MRQFFLFILFFTQFLNVSYSQTKTIDSLNYLIKSVKEDTTKLTILFKLIDSCDVNENLRYALPAIKITDKLLLNKKDSITKIKILEDRLKAVNAIISYYKTKESKNSSKIIEEYNKHFEICKQNNNVIGMTKTLSYIADYYNMSGELIKQLNSLKKGDSICKALNYKKGQARFILQLAFFYSETGDTNLALNYSKKSELLENEIGDTTRITRGYFLRGQFYLSLNKPDLALTNYLEAERRYKLVNDTNELIDIYYSLGNLYKVKSDHINAIKYFNTCKDLAKKINNLLAIASSNIGIGDVFLSQKKYGEAILLHKDALSFCKEKKLEQLIFSAATHLANTYYEIKDFKSVKPIAYEALRLAYEGQYATELLNSEKLVYKTDSALGNYREAFVHFQKYLFFNNKLNAEQIRKVSSQEKFKNELNEQKLKNKADQDKKDAINEEEKQKQNIIIYSISFGLILVLLLIAFILRGYRQKQRSNKELIHKNEIIEEQKRSVEEKQKDIIDSITYARRIQRSLLANEKYIDKTLKRMKDDK